MGWQGGHWAGGSLNGLGYPHKGIGSCLLKAGQYRTPRNPHRIHLADSCRISCNPGVYRLPLQLQTLCLARAGVRFLWGPGPSPRPLRESQMEASWARAPGSPPEASPRRASGSGLWPGPPHFTSYHLTPRGLPLSLPEEPSGPILTSSFRTVSPSIFGEPGSRRAWKEAAGELGGPGAPGQPPGALRPSVSRAFALIARLLCSQVKEAEAQVASGARGPGAAGREQKEQRAALMLGILIGVFALCWIPFFLAALISPLCACSLPPVWKSIFLWLGYSNSFFNPLIYTAFNKNYNNAFRSLFSKQR